MTLWWIGNAIFILVIIPVVVLLLSLLLRPVIQIRKHCVDIDQHAERIVVGLEDAKALLHTRDAVKRVGAGLTRYVTAVDRLL